MTASPSGPSSASSLKAAGSEAKAQAEAALTDIGGKLKHQGRHLRDDAKSEIQRFADQRKQEAASFLDDVSNALRDVTSRLDEKGHDRIAHYASVAADKLKAMGDDLPSRDLSEVLQQVERVARERPAVFVGALFLSGFAAARFLRASGETAAESGLSTASGGDPDYPEREAYHAV